MKKTVISIALFSLSFVFAFAQEKFESSKILVKWNLKQNSYQNQNLFLAEFVVVNNSTKNLVLGNANLYFSYPRIIEKVITKNIAFKNIGGEFCSVQFLKDYPAIAPKDSAVVSYVARGNSFNFTDAPSGLYWVFKAALNRTYPVENFKINHIPAQEKATLKLAPEKIYERNKDISFIPSSELKMILPTPTSYQANAGTFALNTSTRISFANDFRKEAELFNQELEVLLGKRLAIQNGNLDNGVQLKKVTGLADEAYHLQITKDKIVLSASSATGMFYAIQSLKMMMPPTSWAKKSSAIAIPCATVTDAPGFGYRSFMLDVARNFQTKQEIFKILDLLALYKINTLHFHLNDDEGWRLAIPGLPELTEVGATRAHTLDDHRWLHPSYGSGGLANFPGTGFYSKQDFVEILKYAKARHISVIPEVETPGHARAAIKSMDERYRRFMALGKTAEAQQYLLRDTADQSVYRSVQKFNDNVMNIALLSTYAFIEKVVDEIKEMYRLADAPLNTIHLGGDEVPKGVWEKSPAIKELMLANNLKNYDDLWYYYFSKANEILTSKGLYLSGWEEVAMRKTSLDGRQIYIANPDFANKNFHAYVWNNVWGGGQEDLAYRLGNAGYKVILASATNFYFDLSYQNDADEPGLYWASYVDVDKSFYYNPFDHYRTAKLDTKDNPLDPAIFKNKERLTAYGASNIIGIQSQIWSEKIQGPEKLEYAILPKLLGYAERAWVKTTDWMTETDDKKSESLYKSDWNSFVNVLGQRDLERLNYYAGGFNYRIPTVGAKVEDGKVLANLQLPGLIIRYTTNGSEPTIKSPIYTSPIAHKGVVKFKAFNSTGRSGRTVEIYNQ